MYLSINLLTYGTLSGNNIHEKLLKEKAVMDKYEIVAAIKQGMNNAASNTYLMNFDSGGKIETEYFATVSIGQALFNSKTFRIGDEKIIFEYNTGLFLTSTVPLIKKISTNNIFPKHIIRVCENTSRTGRIDIVLLGNNNGISYPKCAIEVKGSSPSKARLFEDIRRNFEYFKHTGNTGKSELNLAFNCAFESFDDKRYNSKKYCFTTCDRDKKIAIIKSKYEEYIREISGEIPPGVTYNIDVFSASENLISLSDIHEENEEPPEDIHLTLGVLIKFER